MKRLVAALRHQGAREIHLRSSWPPLRHPCYFGIDIPQEEALVAAGRTVDEIAANIAVDRLGHLSTARVGPARESAATGNAAQEETTKTPVPNDISEGCM